MEKNDMVGIHTLLKRESVMMRPMSIGFMLASSLPLIRNRYSPSRAWARRKRFPRERSYSGTVLKRREEVKPIFDSLESILRQIHQARIDMDSVARDQRPASPIISVCHPCTHEA